MTHTNLETDDIAGIDNTQDNSLEIDQVIILSRKITQPYYVNTFIISDIQGVNNC